MEFQKSKNEKTKKTNFFTSLTCFFFTNRRTFMPILNALLTYCTFITPCYDRGTICVHRSCKTIIIRHVKVKLAEAIDRNCIIIMQINEIYFGFFGFLFVLTDEFCAVSNLVRENREKTEILGLRAQCAHVSAARAQ